MPQRAHPIKTLTRSIPHSRLSAVIKALGKGVIVRVYEVFRPKGVEEELYKAGHSLVSTACVINSDTSLSEFGSVSEI